MARTRVLSPRFFRSPQVCRCTFAARLLFAGLWGIADREGRLVEEQAAIKIDVFPFDSVDVAGLLIELANSKDVDGHSLIVRYSIGNHAYICIPAFLTYQRPHAREAPSNLPPPPKVLESTDLGDAQPAPTQNQGDAQDAPRSCLGRSVPVPVPVPVTGIRYPVSGDAHARENRILLSASSRKPDPDRTEEIAKARARIEDDPLLMAEANKLAPEAREKYLQRLAADSLGLGADVCGHSDERLKTMMEDLRKSKDKPKPVGRFERAGRPTGRAEGDGE